MWTAKSLKSNISKTPYKKNEKISIEFLYGLSSGGKDFLTSTDF